MKIFFSLRSYLRLFIGPPSNFTTFFEIAIIPRTKKTQKWSKKSVGLLLKQSTKNQIIPNLHSC